MMLFIATLLVAGATYLAVSLRHHESGAAARFSLKRLWWRPWVYSSLAAAGAYDIAQLMQGHLIDGLLGWLIKLPGSFIFISLWFLLFRIIDISRQRPKGTTSTDVVPYSPTDPSEGR